MYSPAQFEERRIEVLHALIGAHPFGVLVTLGAGGLDANHLPFENRPPADREGAAQGLRARGDDVQARAMAALIEAYGMPGTPRST